MRQTHSQVNTLLLIVAVLAVVGGLAIVAVTSPQSFQLGTLAGLFGMASATPAPSATVAPTASPTLPEPTLTPVVSPTRRPTLEALATSTPRPVTETPATVAPPTATEVQLPPDAVALAEVKVEEGLNGRVRDVAGGNTVVAVVANGTQLYVLGGRQQIDSVTWLEVRLLDGVTTGWMADFLLQIVYSRP
jgi:hypothetical protein